MSTKHCPIIVRERYLVLEDCCLHLEVGIVSLAGTNQSIRVVRQVLPRIFLLGLSSPWVSFSSLTSLILVLEDWRSYQISQDLNNTVILCDFSYYFF